MEKKKIFVAIGFVLIVLLVGMRFYMHTYKNEIENEMYAHDEMVSSKDEVIQTETQEGLDVHPIGKDTVLGEGIFYAKDQDGYYIIEEDDNVTIAIDEHEDDSEYIAHLAAELHGKVGYVKDSYIYTDELFTIKDSSDAYENYGFCSLGYLQWLFLKTSGVVPFQLKKASVLEGAVKVDIDSLMVGDIAVYRDGNSVDYGIYIGHDEDGHHVFSHCSQAAFNGLKYGGVQSSYLLNENDALLNGSKPVMYQEFYRLELPGWRVLANAE